MASSWNDFRRDQQKKRLEEEKEKLTRQRTVQDTDRDSENEDRSQEKDSGIAPESFSLEDLDQPQEEPADETGSESDSEDWRTLIEEQEASEKKEAARTAGAGKEESSEDRGPVVEITAPRPEKNREKTPDARQRKRAGYRKSTAGPARQGRQAQPARKNAGRPSAKSGKDRSQRAARSVNQPARPAKTPPSPRTIRRRRRMVLRVLLILAVLLMIGAAAYYYNFRRTYHGYRITRTSAQEDTVSTRYEPMAGKILRYSQDGVSLVNYSLESQWSASYDMSNPVADIRGKRAVIADKDGTTLVMVGEDGVTGTVNTSYAIVKARVSRNGLVAAILDGDGETWINFYSTDGSLIAENQTTLEDPGYPLDVALSDNGVIMMVAYQFIEGSHTTSYIAFYNFGDVGQNRDDRIVSGYTYEGHVIPQIQYLDSSRSAAFCDDGVILFTGNQIPEQTARITTQREIVSTFYDDNNIGLVYKNDNKDKRYTMEVYSTNGDLKFTRDFNTAYNTIKMSDGYILMYNKSGLCVISSDGDQRYDGVIDGSISDVSRIGINRYLLVMDSGVNIMKLT